MEEEECRSDGCGCRVKKAFVCGHFVQAWIVCMCIAQAQALPLLIGALTFVKDSHFEATAEGFDWEKYVVSATVVDTRLQIKYLRTHSYIIHIVYTENLGPLQRSRSLLSSSFPLYSLHHEVRTTSHIISSCKYSSRKIGLKLHS